MKCIQILSIILCLTSSLLAQNKDAHFTSAVEYNDYIIDKQQDVGNRILQFASEKVIDKREQILNAGLPAIAQHVKDIKSMPAWKKNTQFRDASAILFEFYKEIFATSYRKIDAILKDGVTKQERLQLQQINTEITNREAKLDASFKAAQQEFARQNNMSMLANPLQKKVDDLKNRKKN